MPKISELPALTTANNNDAIAIVETSTATTKRITRGDLLKSPLPANAVNNQAIAEKAVTADKIDLATIPKWIPDYGEQQSTNRWASVGSWTNNQGTGFVYAYLYSYRADSINPEPRLTINGKNVAATVSEVATSNGAKVTGLSMLLPVADGDVIAYTNAASVNVRQCYFVPGRWV